MSDMMVIVSKAVFADATDMGGDPLGLGGIYPTTAYLSSSKTIEANLDGDLYLVTVRDERLWLVGRLVEPKRNLVGWVSNPNEEPIVDITEIAADIEFSSGKGINLEKMAMSLQSPRVLTDEDVELLEAAWGYEPEPPIEVTEEQIEQAVIAVLLATLDRSEGEIRADKGRYAAFHHDDGFSEYWFEEIDWDELTLDAEFETEDWVYGRTDFDLARSIIDDELFVAGSTTDVSLKGVFESQNGSLYGSQLAELVRDERIELDQLEYPMFSGRILGGESLVEAMKSLLMLNDFPNLRLVPGEYAELDDEWQQLIDSIEHPAVAAHISMFFQTAQSARCVGAAFSGPDESTMMKIGDSERFEVVAAWWIGEGQGDCWLTRIVDDTIPPVPAFDGRELLIREPAVLPEKSRPARSGQSSEITSTPLREHLRGVQDDDFQTFVAAVGDRDMVSFIAGMSVGQPRLWKLLIPINALVREGNAHAALSLLHTVRGVMTAEKRDVTEYRWAQHLHALGCNEEAVAAFGRCVELGQACDENMLNVAWLHARYARAAYDAGRLDLTTQQADLALAEDEGLGFAIATKALALFDLGEREQAFELLEKVMHFGVDPEPGPKLAAHPQYRELALNHSIPVPQFDDPSQS